jgi:hypothetical protein
MSDFTEPVCYQAVPRDDFPALLAEIAARLARGRMFSMEVAHDDKCPCAGNGAPMPACTCDAVNVTIGEIL